MANPRIEVEIGAKTDNLKNGIGGAKTEVENFSKEVEKSGNVAVKNTDKMSSAFAGVGKVIGAAFAVDALLGFGKSILDTTAEFQKFEAVLTNTLGSNSAAQGALSLIVDFASKTPFQVNELTDSFVKLANRGFIPNVKQLTQLGDLAASTGKSFDQLTEAILDAQTGEFERLKEFGIRASQNGDQVAFTFKGVTVEVEKTDAAIQNYILGLGELEGVSGGMAAISETVGGKISNLGDNFDRLKLALGSQSSGLIANILDASNALIDNLASSLSAVNTVAEKTGQNGFESFLSSIIALTNPIYAETVKLQAKAFDQLDQDALKTASSVGSVIDPIKELEKAQKLASENQKKYSIALSEYSKAWDEFNRTFRIEEQQKIDDYNEKLRETVNIASKIDNISIEIVDDLNEPAKRLDALNKLNATDFSVGFTLPVEPVDKFTDNFKAKAEEMAFISDTVVSAFSGLGNQIANSLNIGNDALKGFIGTLISNTPKIIQALFQQAAARKATALIENQANLQVATGAAIATGAKAAAGLGPVGLALLPVFIGGAVALISKAFGKSGGGSGGGGSVGQGVSGQSFAGSGVSGIGSSNREITGEMVVRGNDLVYVLNQTQNKIAKG